MKIFYGVQGTGNGHITRARAMAQELYAAGMKVDFQFSGRSKDKYFEMDVFNNYQLRDGLTFNTSQGRVNFLKTVQDAKLNTFLTDISRLDLSSYDLIISDFEPITAWAAKKQRKNVLGIGHQYAFRFPIPRQGKNFMAEQILKHFAPANTSIGLHWHHFGQPILPPIIETPELPKKTVKNKILVYLPFEDQTEVINLLAPFENYNFHVHMPEVVESTFPHIKSYPLSRTAFQQNLHDSEGIICNAGFELASESLQLGKKILVKPLHGQMEQLANATALHQLGYGHVMQNLDVNTIEHWLHNHNAVRVTYPNVAKIIVDWVQTGMPAMTRDFIESVWNQVNVEHNKVHHQSHH